MIASPNYLSRDEYFQLEAQSPVKHEYIDGKAYAMAGASDSHVTIALNLAALLRNHVRKLNCRAYISDMKASIDSCNRFYYPDVMVTCDPRDQENSDYKRFPKLIVEVLFKSTEAFDRGDKFMDYQTLESLEEYVLINTRHQRVECFRRSKIGDEPSLWTLESYTPETENFLLTSVNFSGTFVDLYEDVVSERSV